MDFRTKAFVQYNDFLGSVATDMSSAMIDSFTCSLIENHPTDSNGRKIDWKNNHIIAIRAYMSEDQPIFSVNLRLKNYQTAKQKDVSISNVTAEEFLSLFKRVEIVLKRNNKQL